jgi:WD40 repeat protein
VLDADAEGISAIDVHPNGRRLATCGTDPQIKIWKLLAALSEHQGSALVVAFNHNGVLLASGGNDNTVLLYKLHSGAATSKLGASFVNIENWKTVANIRGHSLDVTGLAWSPNDRQLATCSMDGRCAGWTCSGSSSSSNHSSSSYDRHSSSKHSCDALEATAGTAAEKAVCRQLVWG